MSVIDLVELISSQAVFAPVVAFFLSYIHGIFPFAPFIVVAGANGALFGPVFGLLLSWSGALLGSITVFSITGCLGKEYVINYLKKYTFGRKWLLQKYQGFYPVLIARLIPVIPSVGVNVIAGISGVNFWTFLFASAVGKLPFTLLYVLLGVGLISEQISNQWTIIFITLSMGILFIVKKARTV